MSSNDTVEVDFSGILRFVRTDGFIYFCILGFIVMFFLLYEQNQNILAYKAAYEACDPAVICGRTVLF